MAKPRASIKPKQYRVHVTEDVIAASVRGDSQRCMIRNAVAAAIPESRRIVVDLQWIRFTLGDYRYRYALAAVAAYKLASFESGDTPEAFSFSMSGGRVYATKSANVVRPGTARSMREWAVSVGMMSEAQAEAKRRIPRAVKEAYLAENPALVPVPVQSGRETAMATRQARRNVSTDRFYGLRLATGFQPGGQPA